MLPSEVAIAVRSIGTDAGVLDIEGVISGPAEERLMAAYDQLSSSGARLIGLNFAGLASIDSFGVGLLVRLLAEVHRRKQRAAAYGLSEPVRQIFELTQLDEVLELYADEGELLSSVAG